jgi:hypothetical protein
VAGPEDIHDETPHLPPPTLWPLGFAIGVAVVLVGLIVNPTIVASIGGAIAIVFGFLWARDATAELRGHALVVEPERRELRPAGVGDAPALPATVGEEAMPHLEPGERFPRSRFLEGATLGLGGLIGGVVTIPVAGFALLPSFLGQKRHEVDLGPLGSFPVGQWFIATFMTDPKEGEVSRRTAFIRNNGVTGTTPSFTIISNRCAHLGCPVQANGPSGAILGQKNVVQHTANGEITMIPVVPAAQVPMFVNASTPVVTPRPRKVGAIPRDASNQPDSATHWRIQTTKNANTTVKPNPPPKTRLWKT